MGSGASQSKGVNANPRVVYTDRLAKEVKQNMKLDAPVLVDIEHGSIRYRYRNGDKNLSNLSNRREIPHEGDERMRKLNYFYHTRLKDFGKDASPDKENNYKFHYVSQGPNSARQQKVFYVYGKGDFSAQDGQIIKPSEVKEKETEFTWPAEYKLANPTDVFYDLEVLEAHVNQFGLIGEDLLLQNLDSTADKSLVVLTLRGENTTDDVKKILGVKIFKAASNIHIYFRGQKLRNEDVIGDLRDEANRDDSHFKVKLKLM